MSLSSWLDYKTPRHKKAFSNTLKVLKESGTYVVLPGGDEKFRVISITPNVSSWDDCSGQIEIYLGQGKLKFQLTLEFTPSGVSYFLQSEHDWLKRAGKSPKIYWRDGVLVDYVYYALTSK